MLTTFVAWQLLLFRDVQSSWYVKVLILLCFLLTIVSYADVVKVRLMTDKHHEFKGAIDCARKVLLHEGPMAFYKGFSMCWGRVSDHIDRNVYT